VLLDEPFSRLDAALRGQLRNWVWAMLRQRGVPALLVTHDEADAPADAQRIVLSAARQDDHA
jgi:putative thiamine transport system ATP-binding protein